MNTLKFNPSDYVHLNLIRDHLTDLIERFDAGLVDETDLDLAADRLRWVREQDEILPDVADAYAASGLDDLLGQVLLRMG